MHFFTGRRASAAVPAPIRNVLLALARYNPALHAGVARFAGQHGWHLNAEMAYFGRLPRGWRGDGIVALLDHQPGLVRFVRDARVPVVDLSMLRDDLDFPRVVGDHEAIGRIGAEHFLERGFRHFAWFSTTEDAVTRLRWRGFHEALSRAGFGSACGTWIFPRHSGRQRDEWTLKCEFLARRLGAITKPAGVFAFRDADAANVLDACAVAGLHVPDDIAILGSDNNTLICETVRVPLSSVRHDLDRLGYEGAALLQRLIDGKRAPRSWLRVPPQGIAVRQSTDVLAISDGPVRAALQFLQANCGRAIGAQDAAAAARVARRPLERTFREQVGRSIAAELRRLRVHRAKLLLTSTVLSMTDVAAKAGFNTPQYFNRVFHRATGKTPRQFRLQSLGTESMRTARRTAG